MILTLAKYVIEAVGQELVNNLVNRMGGINLAQLALFYSVEADEIAIRKFFVLEFPKKSVNVSVNILHELRPLVADASRPLPLLFVAQEIIDDEINPLTGEEFLFHQSNLFHKYALLFCYHLKMLLSAAFIRSDLH